MTYFFILFWLLNNMPILCCIKKSCFSSYCSPFWNPLFLPYSFKLYYIEILPVLKLTWIVLSKWKCAVIALKVFKGAATKHREGKLGLGDVKIA